MSAVRLRERSGVGDVVVAALSVVVYFVVVLAKCAAWVALLLPAGYLAIARVKLSEYEPRPSSGRW